MNRIAWIDEPAELEEVGRSVRTQGWVVADSSDRIELHVDDVVLGEIRPFTDRADVRKAYPGIRIGNATGFDQLFVMPELSEGSHRLVLKVVTSESAHLIFTRRIIYRKGIETLRLVAVDTSDRCNFHCDMCPAHFADGWYRHGRLADEKLIERVAPFLKNPRYRVKQVFAGSVWGEPLVAPDFFANTEKIGSACPGATVPFTTNGSLLTPSNIDRLLRLKCIDRIFVSVDAGTKETYERIRKGGRWEVLLRNLAALIKEKQKRRLDKPMVSTNFVLMKTNFKELPQYVRKMAGLGVDMISAVNAHSAYASDSEQGIFDLPWKINDVAEERVKIAEQALSIDLPQRTMLHLPLFHPNRHSPDCSFNGASSIYVGIDGEVYPCCVIQSLDREGRTEATSMGNVFGEELESIWNKKVFRDFRTRMLEGQTPNAICVSCPFFYNM